MKLATIILAAGKGTRMKSDKAKVLHEVAGRPMIDFAVSTARALDAERVVCVLGHQADAVRAALDARFGAGTVEIALQKEQKGTGHAVAQTTSLLGHFDGKVLILYGDMPAVTRATLEKLVLAAEKSTLAIVTSRFAQPKGYGRILRDATGAVTGVVEEKDASEEQRQIREINAGIYCVDARFLYRAVRGLQPNNAQGELYLTDIVAAAAAAKAVVATVDAPEEEMLGVNDRIDLDRADQIVRRRIAADLMRAGVTIRQPETCRIEADVTVEPDVEIGPLVTLAGKTHIARGSRIDTGCVITDARIGASVHVKPYSVIAESEVGKETQIGPFAHLRPGSVLGAHVKVGNFVETKKARLGDGAKASHLSYLGDADIGRDVNVGCGTITCNYDGYNKFKTTIGDGAFIGSDTQLVAPVTVGANAVVGAGTTVTEDVPAGALAISRTRQVAIPGYSEKKRKQREAAAVEKARAQEAQEGGDATGGATATPPRSAKSTTRKSSPKTAAARRSRRR